MPIEIDEVDRRVLQLEIELTSLAKEKDDASLARREAIERELAELRERLVGDEGRVAGREGRDPRGRGRQPAPRGGPRASSRSAARDGNLERAAQLRHGEIPELERRLAEAEAAEDEPRADPLPQGGGRRRGRRRGRRALDAASRSAACSRARSRSSSTWRSACTGASSARTRPCRASSNALRRSRAGLSDPDRPIGVFLFLGPTGVGKTELARALAEFMFDSQDAMVRIDMSEYMEKHAVSRLVGAPPGYVGYEEGGQLTEAVRRRPYTVVLLDEIEKAHPDVFNVLLQVMDDGRLTDGQGRTVDFKNAVLIMTSNIPGGRAGAEAAFKPEFINRLDDIVEFSTPRPRADRRDRRPAGRAARRAACASAGSRSSSRDEARVLLGNLGYDPTYGARPLKRTIQKHLVDPLALAILEGEFREGDTVRVDAADGELVLVKAAARRRAGGRA